MHRVPSRLAIAAVCISACAAEPVPDFRLRDVNTGSLRGGQTVSPRDYKMQVTAIYFAEAGCGGCRTQGTHLQSLWNEIKAEAPDLNVEVIGVNHPDHSSYNSLMIENKTFPWLQDTVRDQAWIRYNAQLRDVVILDPRNQLVEIFNLVQNPLNFSPNRGLLKQKLKNAALWVDSDSDQLLDSWELEFFGNLAASGVDDSDNDHANNLAELAFGTNPADAASRPSIAHIVSPQNTFVFSFRRQAGSFFSYMVEASPNLATWDDSLDHFIFSGPPRNTFDGSGTSEVQGTFSVPVTDRSLGFVRIRPVPKRLP